MKEQFEIAGGTIIGRDHKSANKNNQDAYSWIANDEVIAAVVCDGCSEGKSSEVGAKIGARIITDLLIEKAYLFVCKDIIYHQGGIHFWQWMLQDAISLFRKIAGRIGDPLKLIIKEYFLFTIVGAIIGPKETALFSLGDGLFFINNEMIQSGPFPRNEPPYLAYNIIGSSLGQSNPELLDFKVHRIIQTKEVQSILLGTDGVMDLVKKENCKIPGKDEIVGPVSQFWQNDRYYNNPDMIRRKLTLVNRDATKYIRDNKGNIIDIKKENGLLHDDTTLIAIRRKKQ